LVVLLSLVSLAESSTPRIFRKGLFSCLIQMKTPTVLRQKPLKNTCFVPDPKVLLLEAGEFPMVASGDIERSRRDYTTRILVRQQKSKLLHITRHTNPESVPSLPSVLALPTTFRSHWFVQFT
jgi:hypothetical protein